MQRPGAKKPPERALLSAETVNAQNRPQDPRRNGLFSIDGGFRGSGRLGGGFHTHNLKVRGSNPLPATKLRRQVKDLAALPLWRTYLEPAPGSTVEARGCVIVGKSTGYSEARAGRRWQEATRFLCSKG